MNLKLFFQVSRVFIIPIFLIGCEVENSNNDETESPTQMTINGETYTNPSIQMDKYNTHYRVFISRSTFDVVSIKTKDTLGGSYSFMYDYLSGTNKAVELTYSTGSNFWLAYSGSLNISKSNPNEIFGTFDATGKSLIDNDSLVIKNGSFKIERKNINDYSINRQTLFDGSLDYGTVTDIDGNEYKTIKIGDQVWMAENLKVTRFNDGEQLFFSENSANWTSNWANYMYCWPQYDSIFKETYGALYSWINVNQKICPIGWHVPSNEEWDKLNNYLIDNHSVFGFDGDQTGKPLAANQGWLGGSENNSSGFAALPAGKIWVLNGSAEYYDARKAAYWWSTTESSTKGMAYIKCLNYQDKKLESSVEYMTNGMSIRCVKDNSLIVP